MMFGLAEGRGASHKRAVMVMLTKKLRDRGCAPGTDHDMDLLCLAIVEAQKQAKAGSARAVRDEVLSGRKLT